MKSMSISIRAGRGRLVLGLLRIFPNIQFIVTTHSPLVCQGAMKGTVTRLPQPGVERDSGERMSGVALERLLYGDILEAISFRCFWIWYLSALMQVSKNYSDWRY